MGYVSVGIASSGTMIMGSVVILAGTNEEVVLVGDDYSTGTGVICHCGITSEVLAGIAGSTILEEGVVVGTTEGSELDMPTTGSDIRAGAGGVEVYALGLGQTGTVITGIDVVCIPLESKSSTPAAGEPNKATSNCCM